MEYSFMEPPFKVKKFNQMSENEAKIHFDWYLNEIEKRLELLIKAYASTGESKTELDFTKDSLINIWKWYIKNVQIIKGENEKELIIDKGWIMIAMDIGIYFAECFREAHKEIAWGLIMTPKNLAYVNKPVLVGFKTKVIMDTSNILHNQTIKLLEGKTTEDALYNLFLVWENYL